MDALGGNSFLNSGVTSADIAESEASSADWLAGLAAQNTATSIEQATKTADAYDNKLIADTDNGIESLKQQTHGKLMSNMFKNANLINY